MVHAVVAAFLQHCVLLASVIRLVGGGQRLRLRFEKLMVGGPDNI